MLAKIISYAPNRTDAAGKLAKALESAHIGGVKTNRDFLINCLKSSEFIDGNTTTDFIDRVNPARKLTLDQDSLEHVTAVATLWLQARNRDNANVANFMPSGWTNGRLPSQAVVFEHEGSEIKIGYKLMRDGSFKLSTGKNANIYSADNHGIDCVYDDKRHYAKVTKDADKLLVHMPYGDVMLNIKPKFVIPGLEVAKGGLTAAMPG